MGREVRRVPANWQHPRDESDRLIPLIVESRARHNPIDCMPEWPPEECTHFQMFETCTKGTPISPPMESEEALAHWLVDNNISAFGDRTAGYESWLATIKAGFAPSLVVQKGILRSGMDYMANQKVD